MRKVRYEWIGDCPIFNYDRAGLQQMLTRGRDSVALDIQAPGRSGFLVRASPGVRH